MEKRVGFWPRVAAALIDVILISAITFATKGLFEAILPGIYARKVAEMTADPRTAQAHKYLALAAGWGIAAGLLGPFYGLIEGFTGRSPGKLLLGLRIVDEAGQPAPLPTLLIRFAVKSSSNVIAFIAVFAGVHALDTMSQIVGWGIILGFFLVLTESRQALHDKIAGTAVRRKADLGAAALSAGHPSGA
jgi:uncharacterized RDD family membrane protein YckC